MLYVRSERRRKIHVELTQYNISTQHITLIPVLSTSCQPVFCQKKTHKKLAYGMFLTIALYTKVVLPKKKKNQKQKQKQQKALKIHK